MFLLRRRLCAAAFALAVACTPGCERDEEATSQQAPEPEPEPEPTTTPPPSPEPTRAAEPPRRDDQRIDCHGARTCAVLPDGRLDCWGTRRVSDGVPEGTGWVSVDVDKDHACALHEDGHVACWGGLSVPEPEARTFVRLRVGLQAACGLEASGRLRCWGDLDNLGWTLPPSPLVTFDLAGNGGGCGLTADAREVVCWGHVGGGSPPQPPDGTRFEDLVVGDGTSCALDALGQAHCWGAYLGDRNSPPTGEVTAMDAERGVCTTGAEGLRCFGWRDRRPPYQGQGPDVTGTFVAVSTHGASGCAIDAEQHGRCWTHQRDALVEDFGERAVAEVDMCAGTACARLTEGDDIVCHGDFIAGQSQPPTEGTFTALVSTGHTSCALRDDGQLVCWGSDVQGLRPPPEGDTFVELDAAGQLLCARTRAGEIRCWGQDFHGTTEPPSGAFSALAVAEHMACGIRERGGAVVCWGGQAQDFELDRVRDARDGQPDDARFEFDGLRDATAIDASDEHLLVELEDGSRLCFGQVFARTSGLGGGGGGGGAPSPDWARIDCPWGDQTPDQAFVEHGGLCGLDARGHLTCYLGPGLAQPTEPSPQQALQRLRSGCGVTTSGTLTCWPSAHSPDTAPPPGDDFIAVAPGAMHICGLHADGHISCSGSYAGGKPL